MHNLHTKLIKILEICKQLSQNLVNDHGNITRRGPVPQFSDLEVMALSLAAMSKASVADFNYLKDVKLAYQDCQIYSDKGYIGADVQAR